MGTVPVGQRAATLPWLRPAVPAFLALADEHPDAGLLASDPGLILLALRYSRPTPQPSDLQLSAAAFGDSILPEAAARFLESAPDAGRLNPEHAPTRAVLAFARRAAGTAAELARRTKLCPADAAFATGLLSPVGWFLVAAVDPGAVERCRNDLSDGRNPAETQEKIWGLSHDAILRRVGGLWRLPRWLTAVGGNLGHKSETAVKLGAPEGLFAVTRAAVAACEASGDRLGLVPTAADCDPSLFRLAIEIADRIDYDFPYRSDPSPDPFLLVKLLRTAARARRVEVSARFAEAHAELDRLHAELRSGGEQFDIRLRDAKLASLAELAAGAGHEINNPLAVISGNAQLLLSRTDDPPTRVALDSIVRQTRRISEIVKDLMLFARPRPPSVRPFDLRDWLAGVVEEVRPLAAVKGVEFVSDDFAPGAVVAADPAQLARAVTAVIRNGIEAVKTDGVVRLTTEVHETLVRISIEDSGPGLSVAVIDHVFDPFFSGRSAGRGRGLGLPTAWRLMHENGGDVRYEPTPEGRTRFVFEIPSSSSAADTFRERKTA